MIMSHLVTRLAKPKFLFGPVHSRRLGLSLGIDVVPMKTCTYNCIYCQLGHTTEQTIVRREYVPANEVIDELAAFLEHRGEADYLTFSGSGEPTLHSKLGEMIRRARQMTATPVAVLTCGALLFDPQVRADLRAAHVVLPSLNSASPATFRAINRPHGKLRIQEIIKGLEMFRQEYHGKLWLEIMFMQGVNDNAEEIALLKNAIVKIKPDKVHLNTVVRPPSEAGVQSLSEARLQEIAEALGPPAEVIAEMPPVSKPSSASPLISEVENLLARHPATREQIAEYLHHQPEQIQQTLDSLVATGKIEVRTHRGREYFSATAVERSTT